LAESLAAGRFNLGGVVLSLVGVADPLEYAVIATGIAVLVAEFIATLAVGVANLLKLIGDTDDMVSLLVDGTDMLEFDVHTLVGVA